MRWIGIMASFLVLVACSSSEGGASDPVTPETTVLSTTTTLGTTTTTEDPDIAAVREAHLAFLEMFEFVGDPPDPDHPEIARRATGDAYERLRASLTQAQITERRLVGRWDSEIVRVRVEGAEARVEDCLLDALEEWSATGEVLTPADTGRFVRTANLRLDPGGWKVWRLDVPRPAIPCDA